MLELPGKIPADLSERVCSDMIASDSTRPVDAGKRDDQGKGIPESR